MSAPIVSPVGRWVLSDPAGECAVMEWSDADITTRVRVNNNGFPAWAGQLWERAAESSEAVDA